MSDTITKSDRPIIVFVSGSPDQDAATVQELTKAGFDVSFCKQPDKIFAVLEGKPNTWKPTIFIIDIILQGSSGFELVRRISSRFQDKTVPLVMSTPYKSREDELEATSAGASWVIKKPFTPKDVQDILEKERIKKLKGEIGSMVFNINHES